MNYSRFIIAGFAITLLLNGCGKSDKDQPSDGSSSSSPQAQATEPPKKADKLVKLSQYGGSQYCSIASASDGTLHAIFTDRAAAGKPAYLFYRASKDGGTTWTEPKNLSDDESGLSSYYCRMMIDGKGRVYAIWKYITAASDTLDGPGGYTCGIVAYRCLDGASWSKIIRFCDKHAPSVSWFAGRGPDGAVNVIWNQGNKDIDWVPQGGVNPNYANQLNQSVLDGATVTTKVLIAPKPIPTQAEQDAARAKGASMSYDDTAPKREGLWDLRGFIDATGAPHFVAERYPFPRDQAGNSGDPPLMYYDGKVLKQIGEANHTNNFNNPVTLLVDAHGKEHVIRMPVHSEKECVRDYPIDGGVLGEPTDVVAPDKAPGKVSDWQATQLPDGKMAVTVALSQKGGWAPDDVDLYVSTSTGDGKWSTPLNLTDNVGRQAFMSKETSAGGVMKSDTYRPDFAESVSLKDGGVGVIMVNTDYSIIGITNSGVNGSGRAVGSLATGSTSAPWVYYRKP